MTRGLQVRILIFWKKLNTFFEFEWTQQKVVIDNYYS